MRDEIEAAAAAGPPAGAPAGMPDEAVLRARLADLGWPLGSGAAPPREGVAARAGR